MGRARLLRRSQPQWQRRLMVVVERFDSAGVSVFIESAWISSRMRSPRAL